MPYAKKSPARRGFSLFLRIKIDYCFAEMAPFASTL